MVKVPREVTLERERRAWELRQQFWTHARIAAELGVDESTVSRILARLSARYAQAHMDQVAAVKGEQIAQLGRIADEAFQAWARSIGEVTITTRKQTTILGGAGDLALDLPAEEVTTRTETLVGTAAYLAEARAALGEIRKIVGANAPTKVSDPDGQPLDLIKVLIGVDLERV